MELFFGGVLVDGILTNVVDFFTGSIVIETLSSGTELTDVAKFFAGSVVVCVLLSVPELTEVVELCTGFVIVVILFRDTELTAVVVCSVLSVVVVLLVGGDPRVIEGSIEVEVRFCVNSIVVAVGRISNEILVIPVLQ